MYIYIDISIVCLVVVSLSFIFTGPAIIILYYTYMRVCCLCSL